MEAERQEVKSFRLTQSTFDKFNEIKEQLGVSQQGTLEALITAYDLNESAAAQPELKTDIEQFAAMLNAIQNSYLNLIELNSSAETRANNSCKSLLDSKDRTIMDLQQKLIAAEERATAAAAEAEAIKADAEEAEALQTEAMYIQKVEAEKMQKELIKLNSALADKNKIIKQCEDNIKLAKEQSKNYAHQIEEINKMVADYKKTVNAAKILSEQLDEKEKLIKNIQTETELQIKTARAETKELYLDKLEASRQEKEQLQNENNELKNKIRELEKELEAATVNN